LALNAGDLVACPVGLAYLPCLFCFLAYTGT
jgi:hypothetical protein